EIDPDTPVSPRRQAAQIAQHSIGLLASSLDRLPEVATPHEWVDALTQLAESLGLELEPSPQSAWSRIREGAVWIERSAGENVPRWSLGECLDYLRDTTRWMLAPLSQSREARVAVLGLPAARYTRPRHMIVVGLGEKGLVLSGDHRGLLSDEEILRMASAD